MKIAVNALALLKPYTGIGQYTKNLIESLGKIDKSNEYILVVPKKLPKGIKFSKNIKVKVLPEKKFKSAGMRKTWWEQIIVPEFFVKEKVDIAFFPYPSNPWTLDFYKKNIKVVLTVHDCIPWKHRHYRKGLLSKMYHGQSKRAVKKADLVLTVSKSSKKDIVDICKVPEKKVEVIYNDVSKIYKKKVSDSLSKKILEKYNLKKGKYLVYVGGYDKRKNVKFLINEYLNLDTNLKLVLVGDKLFQNKLYKSLDYANNENIVHTGFLPEEEIAALYKNSFAFIHLSKEEGFNIPIIEAANQGAPLILSNIKVHKEIAASAALYVGTNIKTAIKKMSNQKTKNSYKRKSKKLAENYSWEKSAKKFKNMLSSMK
jgi:glycosyltransferase involved in cell wall biosynthesis